MADYYGTDTPQPGIDDGKPPAYNFPAAPALNDETDTTTGLTGLLKEYQERVKRSDAQIDELQKQFKESMGAERQEREKMAEETAPLYKRALDLASEPVKELPPQQPLPPPPNPKQLAQQAQESTATWINALVPFALIAGAFSKGGAYAASTAMTGLLTGIQEGNQDTIEKEYKQWKAATDYAVAQNKQEVDQYNRILNNRKLNLDQMINEINLVAAKHQDAIVAEAANRRNLVDLGRMIEFKEKSGESLERTAAQIELIKAKIDKEKAKAQIQKEGGLSPSAAEHLAYRAIALGDYTGLNNLRNQAARIQVLNAMDDVQEKYHISDTQATAARVALQGIMKEQGVISQRAGNLDLAVAELKELIPLTVRQIDAVKRKQLLPLNDLLIAGRTKTGNVEEVVLGTSLDTLINTHAVVRGRGRNITTDSARHELQEQLAKAQTKEQMKGVIKFWGTEVETVRRAPVAAQKELGERLEKTAPKLPGTAPPTTEPTNDDGFGEMRRVK